MSCESSSVAWGGAGLGKNAAGNLSDSSNHGNHSFKDLMSEELAKDLQQKEELKLFQTTHQPVSIPEASIFEPGSTCDTSSDLLLALCLQKEFDKEYDSQIQREEKHYNNNSKVSISLSKYKVYPDAYQSDDEYSNCDDENRALDSFEESKRSDPVIPACGYTRHNNQMVTKHDKTLAGRRNAERVMNFPPGINTGDGGGFDMQFSNKVYNSLARTAMSEMKRKQRVHDKVEKATAEKVLDPKTRLIVYKMVNNSILEGVNGIIGAGKESVVFHANGGVHEEMEIPSECAVKVFKTILTDFTTRERYIKDDFRFKDRLSKNNTKTMMKLWAEKEFHNLRRMEQASIPSPKPLLIKKHVLVMSFIGKDHSAAPQLKHVRLSQDQWTKAFHQVVEIMTKMYRECKLVHADMSEYNILWFDERCWVIDVGQAVTVLPLHPNSLQFLHRDCMNVVGFFRSKGLSDLPSPLELLQQITELEITGPEDEAARMIEEYEETKELWRKDQSRSDDEFEMLWRRIENVTKVEEELEELEEGQEEVEESVPETGCEGAKTRKKRNRRKKKGTEKATPVPEPDEDHSKTISAVLDLAKDSD